MSEQTSSGVMAGKRGLIMGVANERSIAWGIAAKLAEQGAELAFTFQGEALHFMKQLCRVNAADIRPEDAALIDRGISIFGHVLFFDEDRVNVVTGLKCRVVPLDPVNGELAREADNPADRLKVTFDFLITYESGKVGPGRHGFIEELLCPFGAKTPFQLSCGKSDIATGNATIAGRCPFADQAFLENDNLFSGACQCEGRGQAGKAAPDNDDFGIVLPYSGRSGRRWPFLPPEAGDVCV
ncbi:MAG: SDR family oxidoreductase [Pseudomonadota bacterium]|nr:SDR family oxidoreductase [Pseudomonadota bacterium]